MESGGNSRTGPFTLTLSEVISREPSLAGRSTGCSNWKGVDLVVKISWPGSGRIAEDNFLKEATKEGEWALNHLTRVSYAQDVIFDADSTHEKVATLFDDTKLINGKFQYERCTLRIIVQERLRPLKTLTNAKDATQVMLEVACSACFSPGSRLLRTHSIIVHRWLYGAGILHWDMSPNNIMYRISEGRVCGVLTDYDLASWTASLASDYTKSSRRRTGTPPFMANALLDGTDRLHLYRHDLESRFCHVDPRHALRDSSSQRGEERRDTNARGKTPVRRLVQRAELQDTR